MATKLPTGHLPSARDKPLLDENLLVPALSLGLHISFTGPRKEFPRHGTSIRRETTNSPPWLHLQTLEKIPKNDTKFGIPFAWYKARIPGFPRKSIREGAT